MTSRFDTTHWNSIPFGTVNTSWYAIVDCCDSPKIQNVVFDDGVQSRCLWKGKKGSDYWAIAPFLLTVTADTFLKLQQVVPTDHWGFVFTSKLTEQEVFNHFRRFTLVELPNGQLAYFRYYDPRVLTTLLENVEPEGLRNFLGTIENLYIPLVNGEFKVVSSPLPEQ